MKTLAAFPVQQWEYDGQGNVLQYQEAGMFLRDYFAAKTLQSISFGIDTQPNALKRYDLIAEHAYKMADAMMKARESK